MAPALCEIQTVLRQQGLRRDACLTSQAPDDALPLIQRRQQGLILLLQIMQLHYRVLH